VTIEDKHNRRLGHVTVFSDAPNSVVEFGEGIDW
jgi:phosphoribosylaminoimidazole carboxylase ATPase subunit purK